MLFRGHKGIDLADDYDGTDIFMMMMVFGGDDDDEFYISFSTQTHFMMKISDNLGSNETSFAHTRRDSQGLHTLTDPNILL